MRLGCGEWTALITGRGGSPVRFEVEYSDLNYTLPLSSGGSYTIDVPFGSSPSCCELAIECDSYADEISLYRDGKFVFCGPLIGMPPKDDGTGIAITGKDLFTAWMEKRFIDDDLNFHQDVAEVFAYIVEYAMSKDPSPNLSVRWRNTGTKGTRKYDGEVFRKCADALNELTGTDLDYAVAGRTVYAGDLPALLPDETLLLHDKGIQGRPNIRKLGADLVNDMVVIGEIPARETKQVFGRATRNVEKYGLLQDSLVDLHMHDVSDCEASALARVRANFPVPLMIEVTLSPDAEMEFADLIPGRTMRPLLSGEYSCLEVLGPMLLEQVRVTDGPNGEAITVNLVPLGDLEGE